MNDRRSLAASLVRNILSLGDATLRASHVASLARSTSPDHLARVLDVVCERAEQADAGSREALIAIVDALNAEPMKSIVRQLREVASVEALLALGRLVRHPPVDARDPTRALTGRATRPVTGDAARAATSGPDVATSANGRPLTLGERKSLARRPDRDLIVRLLADPHPDVVGRCLSNPRTIEDDVVRLAARRPGRAEALAAIARSRWAHRPRVRMAVVMNPATPLEIAGPLTGLLLRPELAQVASSPAVPASVRNLCREHLERRPPIEARGGGRLH